MIVSGREDMSDSPSEEAIRQLHLRYKLTADVAKSYFEDGFSVVIQDSGLDEATGEKDYVMTWQRK